jgi:hypothetical protein
MRFRRPCHFGPDVRAAAQQIWDSACRRVQSLLGDASEAPELMEKVVVQVSRYLDRSGAGLFTQNTTGVLMCGTLTSPSFYI